MSTTRLAFGIERLDWALGGGLLPGTLTVVAEKAGKYEVLADVKTQVGARTCALDAKTHNAVLVTATMKPAAKGGRPQPEPDSFVVLVVGR